MKLKKRKNLRAVIRQYQLSLTMNSALSRECHTKSQLRLGGRQSYPPMPHGKRYANLHQGLDQTECLLQTCTVVDEAAKVRNHCGLSLAGQMEEFSINLKLRVRLLLIVDSGGESRIQMDCLFSVDGRVFQLKSVGSDLIKN